MYCYKCGCELTESDTCPNCKADVKKYKQIIYTSNYMYNQGLEKANVRDLSGAIVCLKQALVYNKDNLDARNLLGLVYYEIGEIVAALSEWVISKNLNDSRLHYKENMANTYLNQVQNDRQVMANISSSIKRYNHALDCCYSGNYDVAVLQLRKVISVYPHYLRARQLLSLLLIQRGEYRKAERELQKCLRLDINNTDTLRYLKEVEENLQQREDSDALRKRKQQTAVPRTQTGNTKPKVKNGVVKYTADNETIIQPVGGGVPGIDGFRIPGWVYGLAIGVIAGAAAVAFLIVPSRVQTIRNEAADQVRTLSEQVDSDKTTIADLESQVEELQSSASAASTEAASTEETESSEETTENAEEDALLATANSWVSLTELQDGTDTTNLTDSFAALDPATAKDGQSDAFATLYDTLYDKLQDPMLERYAWAGIGEYEKDEPDYSVVITDLEIANRFEIEGSYSMTYVERLWYLGDSYYQVYTAATEEEKSGVYSDYLDKARTCLETVTENYADSEYASDCEARLLDIAATSESTADSQAADNAAAAASTNDSEAQSDAAAEDSSAAGSSQTTSQDTAESGDAAAQ